MDAPQVELSSSAPTKEPFLRIGSKRMGKTFNPFSSSSASSKGAEKESQQPNRLLQLAKSKEKKDKRKKKGKGEQTQTGAMNKGYCGVSCSSFNLLSKTIWEINCPDYHEKKEITHLNCYFRQTLPV